MPDAPEDDQNRRIAPANDEDVDWGQSISADDPEYLDRLQNKLARLKARSAPRPTSRRRSPSPALGDSEPDENGAAPALDDDPGLHLLYAVVHMSGSRSPSPPPPHTKTRISLPEVPRSGVPATTTTLAPPAAPPVADTPSKERSVRFRPRVRITSGVHVRPDPRPHLPRSPQSRAAQAVSEPCDSSGLGSASSSVSGSSSISAPLRQEGEHSYPRARQTSGPHAAALSNILSSQAASSWLGQTRPRATHGQRRRSGSGDENGVPGSPDERTPLTSERPESQMADDEHISDHDALLDRVAAATRKTEEEVMFGKWPWRIFDVHWWRWKFEFLCCCSRHQDDDLSDVD